VRLPAGVIRILVRAHKNNINSGVAQFVELDVLSETSPWLEFQIRIQSVPIELNFKEVLWKLVTAIGFSL
jgi:hypothetical protein